jgi:hypothetical protein
MIDVPVTLTFPTVRFKPWVAIVIGVARFGFNG